MRASNGHWTPLLSIDRFLVRGAFPFRSRFAIDRAWTALMIGFWRALVICRVETAARGSETTHCIAHRSGRA